ncbi:serine/threonine-protein kinase haspin-like [Plakobranchus ocellatus]|uniref:Serine/threonine-protein kinase haspin-like n=1 Tax=Plakobranchus ocellatus TaxID=259542 RepID=A0AAV4B7N4_9GAST|nr:serine/threonine-protein kinase haspin-like [Plakobranchus ocellatus]
MEKKNKKNTNKKSKAVENEKENIPNFENFENSELYVEDDDKVKREKLKQSSNKGYVNGRKLQDTDHNSRPSVPGVTTSFQNQHNESLAEPLQEVTVYYNETTCMPCDLYSDDLTYNELSSIKKKDDSFSGDTEIASNITLRNQTRKLRSNKKHTVSMDPGWNSNKSTPTFQHCPETDNSLDIDQKYNTRKQIQNTTYLSSPRVILERCDNQYRLQGTPNQRYCRSQDQTILNASSNKPQLLKTNSSSEGCFNTTEKSDECQVNSDSSFPCDASIDLFEEAPKSLCDTMNVTDSQDAERKVMELCDQTEPMSFTDCIPPKMMADCIKIGEGVYGEVFKSFSESMPVALKIIPIEGDALVNDCPQKKFEEILPEIVIAKISCVRGMFPLLLLDQWDQYAERKKSENDRPDFFTDDQLFIVFEFGNGGCALESFKFQSQRELYSVLRQVVYALAVAEEELEFEHRDLHIGNVLVKSCEEENITFILQGNKIEFPTEGVCVTIIDFTISRLKKGL